MRRNKQLAAIAFISLFAGQPAVAADLLSAEHPERILDIAKGFGSAKLEKDSDGDPAIQGRIEGTRYSVYFYGCKDGKDCEDIQFVASWSGYEITTEAINHWNSDSRFGSAFIDSENDPVIQMTVNLKYGVSQENLDDTFDWWRVVLREFRESVLKE